MGLEVVLIISESEARALDALAGYGDDAFIKQFYEHLGKHYMEPHEKGLRLFLKTIREGSGIGSVLSRMDDARQVFDGSKVALYPPDEQAVKPTPKPPVMPPFDPSHASTTKIPEKA